MSRLERLENRLHWLAVPGCFKWVTLLGVVVFASQWISPDISRLLSFDRKAILAGEWWRVITFIFDSGFGALGPLAVVFLFFAVMISFLINDTLEEIWGSTRLTLYILVAWIALGGAHWVLPLEHGASGTYLYLSVFFAFATYVPRYEFRLFFFLPVQVRWLAWLLFAVQVLTALSNPAYFLLLLAITLPYLIWVLPDFLKARRGLAIAAAKRRGFESRQLPKSEAFHRCATCGRTEQDDPALDFRTMEDGTEFCTDHLPEH
ncbi:MAG: hypothetical protein MUF31_00190 [Akkermansiaceae bacterium]|jgi:hypothetical protein|nr:hypothetical protein [Akkermansiaceae bacterium]